MESPNENTTAKDPLKDPLKDPITEFDSSGLWEQKAFLK